MAESAGVPVVQAVKNFQGGGGGVHGRNHMGGLTTGEQGVSEHTPPCAHLVPRMQTATHANSLAHLLLAHHPSLGEPPQSTTLVAPHRPTLLSAIMKGVLRMRSMLMLSIVCCSRPCMRSTHRTAMSHSPDPRARRLVKDSWPGVSITSRPAEVCVEGGKKR